ncbi:UNVERIFIED_CONTAM: class I tRNA ligase family protein, partial [Bacillus sp. ATCC 13368]
CEVTAPLLPLLTEESWRALTGGESVHLQDWPTMPEAVRNDELVAVMDAVRQAVSGAHALRKTHNLRVRQPLRQLSVVSEAAPSLEPFASLIASEVNVKNVTLVDPDHSG